MSAKAEQIQLAAFWTARSKELLQDRNNLTQGDLEYLVLKASMMKDERFKQCIATLVGWGDEERAEMETFCAIAIELMKSATPSKVRDAARIVELRYLMKEK